MENTQVISKKKDMYSKIVITQTICIVLILLSLLTVKLFFKDTFSQIKKWYTLNICVDTDINQVLETNREIGDISEI